MLRASLSLQATKGSGTSSGYTYRFPESKTKTCASLSSKGPSAAASTPAMAPRHGVGAAAAASLQTHSCSSAAVSESRTLTPPCVRGLAVHHVTPQHHGAHYRMVWSFRTSTLSRSSGNAGAEGRRNREDLALLPCTLRSRSACVTVAGAEATPSCPRLCIAKPSH